MTLFLQTAIWAETKTAEKDPSWEQLSFSVEDSRSFVGIASVHLSVSELVPKDGKLIGYYTINVPLKKSKNDHGKIILPLEATVRELGEKGGTLKGEAHSKLEAGIINTIVCEIIPEKDRTIKLAITTKDRTVNFKSRYTVVETSTKESDS